MKKKHFGFTMIELIVVIIILGILASYAVPKFVGIDKAARASIVKGLLGATKSASEMVYAIAVSKGTVATGTEVDIGHTGEEIIVKINKGYATATSDGIIQAIDITVQNGTTPGDFVVTTTADSITIVPASARDGAGCNVTYKYSATDTKPVVTADITDCS